MYSKYYNLPSYFLDIDTKKGKPQRGSVLKGMTRSYIYPPRHGDYSHALTQVLSFFNHITHAPSPPYSPVLSCTPGSPGARSSSLSAELLCTRTNKLAVKANSGINPATKNTVGAYHPTVVANSSP